MISSQPRTAAVGETTVAKAGQGGWQLGRAFVPFLPVSQGAESTINQEKGVGGANPRSDRRVGPVPQELNSE